MPDCSHDCSSCNVEGCGERSEIKKIEPNKETKIKKIVAIISGKGGVGKSLVTSLTAVALAKKGYKVAILDADITGPSIPQAFGLENAWATQDGTYIYPVLTKLGIKVMSVNLLLDNKEDPVVWRGPILSGFVQQMFTDVNYGELDYLLIDMPPGTGDVPLTVFQVLPIDGIVVVTSPQDLVSMVVNKSINMAKLMNIPIYGMVKNMAYVECPNCKERIEIFSGKKINENPLPLLAELPIDPHVAELVDTGHIEDYNPEKLEKLVDAIKF